MKLNNSLLQDLVTEYSILRPQIYFKSSLIALARAIQDVVLADSSHQYLIIANFQKEQFFLRAEQRFQEMAQRDSHIYILGVPNVEFSLTIDNPSYEKVTIGLTDTLAGEDYLVVIGKEYCACVVAQEKFSVKELKEVSAVLVEQGERFEGIWSFNRDIVYSAADWLLGVIANYRPELKTKIQQSRKLFQSYRERNQKSLLNGQSIDLGIFTQRLVTYLQAGQYKLLKAYKAIAVAKRKEHLINKIAQAQSNSLNPQEILQITVRELGLIFPQCRCILYQINPDDTEVIIEYESVPLDMPSLVGQQWSVVDNPLFIVAQTQDSALVIDDVAENVYLLENPILKEKIKRGTINSWLMVSIRYQKTLLGILELHHSGLANFQPEDVALVEAVANSTGTALTQGSAYNNLVELNQQLAAVERIQGNLIAVVGHELRTPLSTIRICLETLAGEPDMPYELRETMLDTALSDSERLGQLIQDFLILSKLETGKIYRDIESVSLEYPLNLALHRIKRKAQIKSIPDIQTELPSQLPSVIADIEGLVEVFSKLLDNACKFTPIEGEVSITAKVQNMVKTEPTKNFTTQMLEVIIADTGRGIETNELEMIFDRFSQSENYLRRTVNGTGLGLVICRQILNGIGGAIWAVSEGKNKGSQFHITIPVEF